MLSTPSLVPHLALELSIRALLHDLVALSNEFLRLREHPRVTLSVLLRANNPVSNVLREVLRRREDGRLRDMGCASDGMRWRQNWFRERIVSTQGV